jgi:hypothetical protein
MPRDLLTAVLTGSLLLGGIGCEGDTSDQAEDGTTTSSTQPVAETTTTSSAPAAPSFMLRSIDQGDHACYLTVQPAAGDEEVLPGGFELCPGGTSDASHHVGSGVTLERRPERTMADSCAGDPNCTDTKTVDLVVAVKPVAGSPP